MNSGSQWANPRSGFGVGLTNLLLVHAEGSGNRAVAHVGVELADRGAWAWGTVAISRRSRASPWNVPL